MIAGADLWLDLGCGNGYAASLMTTGLEQPPRRTLLVDVAAEPLATAARTLAELDPDTLQADLSEPAGLSALSARVREHAAEGDRVAVTCMETLEHLRRFSDLVEWLSERVEHDGADVVLSVPNDAFWAIENPYHETTWGAGAAAELRTLLPAHRSCEQFPVNGSWIVPEGAATGSIELRAEAGEASVPSHFLLALGPNRDKLDATAGAVRTDLSERRTWERQRESSLQWLEQRVSDLEYLMSQHEAGQPDRSP